MVRRVFFNLYLIMDLYSRRIVGRGVYDHESADLAASVLRKAQDRGLPGRSFCHFLLS
jgi:transposase InsO family protein